jgi:hypothetical protein
MTVMKAPSGLILVTAWIGMSGCTVFSEWAEESTVLLRPDGDVVVADAQVDLAEDAEGDVMTVGAEVAYAGTVGGSYLGAGGVQEVGGRIGGSVRIAAAAARVMASVGRNVTAVGREIELDRESNVAHNAYLAGERVVVEGTIERNLYVAAAEVVLDGIVGGDVRVEAGELRLGPDARIHGDLRYRVEGTRFSMDPVAMVQGETEALTPREERNGDIPFRILRLLGFVFAGAVLVALLPTTTERASDQAASRPAAAMGLGLLGAVLVPAVLSVVAATVVGLPLALIGFGLYAVSLYLAPAVAALWLGSELLPLFGARDQGPVTRFLVGGPLVAIMLLLPGIGLLARLLAVTLGLGTVWLLISEEWGRRGEPRAPAATTS